MKNSNKYWLGTSLLVMTSLLTGCSDEFLKEKQDYTRVVDEIYNDYAGSNARINNIYSLCLPESNTAVSYDNPSTGSSDLYSASTEEYGGLTDFVDPGVAINNETVVDFFYNEAKTSRSPWGRIRNCNDAIAGISGGTLTDDQKRPLLGQAYFFRAWTYYRLVKVYGGVPIVDEVQNPMVGTSGGLDLSIPRSTTRECIEFICSDLEKAAAYLPKTWSDANWGRISAGTALALEGRVRNLYASPLFNRTDDLNRWQLAYEVNKRALDTLDASGFYGLAYAATPGVNAGGWAKMFSETKSKEAVFVTLYNNVATATNSTSPEYNNTWENAIRPTNSAGGGGVSTTAEMVDLFPMKSGLPAVDNNRNAINGYDKDIFFKNRDPRFYRTFAFPGVTWSFNGTPSKKTAGAYPYSIGTKYQLWNYSWYETTTKRDDESLSGYGADKLGTNYKGIYVRKRTDDFEINSTPLYVYDTLTTTPFRRSAAPYMEIRYAEVLLNFAEAACGVGKPAEALAALRKVRMRVGYTGNCGLSDNLASNRGALFAAILYERQIELAFEGKRFDDMRRWLLWDGGTGLATISGAPSTWTLTGFGGNTCTYLGVSPLNGQRRNGMELRVSNATTSKGVATATDASDPIFTLASADITWYNNKVKRPQAWNVNLSDTIQRDSVITFYTRCLTRKARTVDAENKVVTFRPEYYLIGLKKSAQTNNSTLIQTIGWMDSQKGSMGTFDPLAE